VSLRHRPVLIAQIRMGCKPPSANFSAFIQGLFRGRPPGVPDDPGAGLPIPAQICNRLQPTTGGHGAIQSSSETQGRINLNTGSGLPQRSRRSNCHASRTSLSRIPYDTYDPPDRRRHSIGASPLPLSRRSTGPKSAQQC